MRNMLVVIVTLFTMAVSGGAGGCALAAPVRPAPLAPEQAASLKSSLVGNWRWVAQQRHGEEREEMPTPAFVRWEFTFGADGSMRFNNAEAHWSLEGANIVTTSAYETLRADAWGRDRLKLFWYGDTTTMYLERM